MMQSIFSSVMTRPAATLCFIAGPSDDSTPMILILGFDAFSAIDTPEINPPPPIGTTATSTPGKSRNTSRPSVPLAGDELHVVKRMDVGQPALLTQLFGLLV